MLPKKLPVMQDKDNKNKRYIAINMAHFKGIFEDKAETLNKAICRGIYHYGTNIKVDVQTALKTCLIAFVNEKPVFDSVAELFYRYELHEWEKEDLFNDGLFDIGQIYLVQPDFKIPESLESDFIQCAKIILAMKNLNISGDPEQVFNVGEDFSDGKIFAILNHDVLFNYRDNEKTEFELMQFLTFAAFQSIIGQKSYCRSNKKHVFNRMFPNPNQKEKTIIEKYNGRYQWTKLIDLLEMNWNLKYYSYRLHGFYFSFRTSLENLIQAAEGNRSTKKREEHKKKKNDLRKKVLKQRGKFKKE